MKTYRQFVESNQYMTEINLNPLAGVQNAMKTAAQIYQYATGMKTPQLGTSYRDPSLRPTQGKPLQPAGDPYHRIGYPQQKPPSKPFQLGNPPKPSVPQPVVKKPPVGPQIATAALRGAAVGTALDMSFPRPAGKGSTLQAARERGEYIPTPSSLRGPVGPKDPDAGLTKAQSFDKAFKSNRQAGKKEFTWAGKRYTTKLKGE